MFVVVRNSSSIYATVIVNNTLLIYEFIIAAMSSATNYPKRGSAASQRFKTLIFGLLWFTWSPWFTCMYLYIFHGDTLLWNEIYLTLPALYHVLLLCQIFVITLRKWHSATCIYNYTSIIIDLVVACITFYFTPNCPFS